MSRKCNLAPMINVYRGEAEHLKEGSIRNVNGRVVGGILKSKTDLLDFQIGASVRF